MQLQRELRQRDLMDPEALQRLDAIGLCWEPEVLPDAQSYDRHEVWLVSNLICYKMLKLHTRQDTLTISLKYKTAT